MAFSEELAGRIRDVLDDRSRVSEKTISEKKMFGGLADWVHRALAFVETLPAK